MLFSFPCRAGNATLGSLLYSVFYMFCQRFLGRFSSLAFQTGELDEDDGARPLAESLLLAVADLLFCPDFTVHSHRRGPVSVRSPALKGVVDPKAQRFQAAQHWWHQ